MLLVLFQDLFTQGIHRLLYFFLDRSCSICTWICFPWATWWSCEQLDWVKLLIFCLSTFHSFWMSMSVHTESIQSHCNGVRLCINFVLDYYNATYLNDWIMGHVATYAMPPYKKKALWFFFVHDDVFALGFSGISKSLKTFFDAQVANTGALDAIQIAYPK